MARKYYFALFLISLLIRSGVGWLQDSPGFMDAEYYYIGGLAIAQGKGFSEEILWNYLDDPSGIPHPSHGYWMPLASIVAALGMFITQNQSFAGTQWIFILLSSLIPPITAYLGYQLSKNTTSALLAGGVASFAGFYLPYWSTSDTFGIYAVLGGVFFTLLSKSHWRTNYIPPILLGIIAGLMHLTRADGILWLGFAWMGSIWAPSLKPEKLDFIEITKKSFLVIVGYLLVMGPWFFRNLQVFGSIMAPGGSRGLWITSYNELFIYPASYLTLERWLASGWAAIFEARTWALGINLQRSLAEQGMIFLTPLILLGFWHQRNDFRIRLASFIWLCTLLSMTLIFPYQGARGGFFHSSAALLPIFWAAAPLGLNSILEWAGRKRGWNVREARIVFSVAILLFAIFISVFALVQKVILGSDGESPWEENAHTYQNLEDTLTDLGANSEDIAMMVNPPGYYALSERQTIAIPDGDIQTTLGVAEKFGARYLLLERSHPEGLDSLYANPDATYPGLDFLRTVKGTHIFLIK